MDAAAESTRGAVNGIFALAVKKYAVEGANDATARAEGLAFSWGLHGQLARADLASIQAAFGGNAPADAADSVAATLDAAASKLGFDAPLPPTAAAEPRRRVRSCSPAQPRPAGMGRAPVTPNPAPTGHALRAPANAELTCCVAV